MKRPRSLKARALQWPAQREYSRLELRRKLLSHARLSAAESAACGDTPRDVQADVEAVLDWLEASRFLSAERFAESRINARLGRFGNVRIRHELGRHEIRLAPEAEQALRDSELMRACSVHRRRFSEPPPDAGARARQARFLAARGFSSDVIRRVLRSVAGATDLDEA